MLDLDRRCVRAGLATALGLACVGSLVTAQEALLLSTNGSAQVLSARFAAFTPAALLRFEPGASAEVHPVVHAQTLDVFVGDGDSNAELDDAPTNIDAIAWSPAASQWRTPFDLAVSFSTTTRFAGGSVRDGDVVQMQPGGGFVVVADEATLSSVTSTSGIDVDAIAFLPSGELAFSLAEDEVTTDPALIAANGNDPKLGDETIFAWRPGQPAARILHTKAALIAMASAAVQQNLSSIVDVTGIALDPGNPGELLFTTGSSSRALGGKVFTTAGGGAIASLNSVPLDGQNSWGLDAQPVLDALEVYPQSKDPVGIRASADRIVTPAPTSVTIDCYGAAAGGTVQLFVSHARFPAQTPFAMPIGIGGFPFGFLSPGDPLFAQSASVPILRVGISTTGLGAVRIPVGQVPPGTTVILQGVDLSTREATLPLAIDFTAS